MFFRTVLQFLARLSCLIMLGLPIICLAAEEEPEDNPAQTEYFEEDAVLNMEGMAVTGNQELPKSLMIVPWQEPGAGDLFAGEFESLIDRDPSTIDRTEFVRELDYYRLRKGEFLDPERD